jgi:chromosome segregation ATPase
LPELLELFVDVKPTYTAKSYSKKTAFRTYGNYSRNYEIVPKKPEEPLTLERLQAYAEKLSREHPQFKFWVEKVEVEGKTLAVIRRSESSIEVEEARRQLEALKAKAENERNKLLNLQQQLNKVEYEIRQIIALKGFRRLLKTLRLIILKRRRKNLSEGVKKQRLKNEAIDRKLSEAMEKLKTLEEKCREEAKPWMPIYFDLSQNKVYIEKELWSQNPKLYTWAIHRMLGWLGVAQAQYRGYIH